MSWKEKFFELISTRFYTKEEIDSKATVVFIGYSNEFSLYYNGKEFTSDDIRISYNPQTGDSIVSNILVMELSFGEYDFEATSEYGADMVKVENGTWEVNQKLIFADVRALIGEPQVTTQQEI